MNGLFVSREHKRQADLRTHRAYHCIVFSILILAGLQVPFALVMIREKETNSLLIKRKILAVELKTQLNAKLDPLKESWIRIQEARSWGESSARRMTVSEILLNLEKTVSSGVCLTEITIHNRAQGPKDPDRFEIEVRGLAKTREPETWKRALEGIFVAWNVTASGSRKLVAAEASDSLVPFSLLLQQITTP